MEETQTAPAMTEAEMNAPRCIAVMPKADAKRFIVALAMSGIPVTADLDADGKRLHVSVPTWQAKSPIIWLITIRGEADRPATCMGDAATQHSRSPKA